MALSYAIKDAKLEKDIPGEKKKIVLTETVEKELCVEELLRKVEEVNSGIERLQGRKLKLVQDINAIIEETGIELSEESQSVFLSVTSLK